MMMDRRDILAGFSCVAVLGTAELLRPRKKLVLMPAGAKLTDLIPSKVPGWSAAERGDIVIPRTEGTLATRLYSDQVARRYSDATGTKPDIMILGAYGAAQNDLLQLHRPEVCYPAIGFEIEGRHFVDIATQFGPVPAVALTARSIDRVEDIVYWTRIGNSLPQTAGQQRADKMQAAFAGYVGDGVLFRSSAVRRDDTPLFGELIGFLTALIGSLEQRARVALLGRPFAG
jgi:EpsI family protein